VSPRKTTQVISLGSTLPVGGSNRESMRRPLLGRGLVRQSRIAGILFTLPATLVFLVVLTYPIFQNVRTTFYSVSLMTGQSKFIGFDNIVQILEDQELAKSVSHTIVWTVASLVGQIGLGLIAALLIDKPWRGMRFLRTLFLIPYVVPVIASALLWQWMLDGHYGIVTEPLHSLGLVSEGMSPLGQESTSLAAAILINIWRGFPFAMLVFWAAMQTIDQGQYEAASLDGAGPWRSFISITMPNLMPAVVALIALRGIWTLMYFELIWLTTQGGPMGSSQTVAVYLYKVTMGEFQLGYGAAIATVTGLSLLVMIGVIMLFRRWWRNR